MSSKNISDNKNTQDLKQSKSSKSLTRQSKLAKSDKENRNNTNMTPIKPKRFSAMIREIDYNAYRAYKMANEDPKINPKSRNPHDILKNDYNPLTVKASIKEYCKKNLASYAIPREFEFRKSLPKTLIGKVDFKRLREEAVEDAKEK